MSFRFLQKPLLYYVLLHFNEIYTVYNNALLASKSYIYQELQQLEMKNENRIEIHFTNLTEVSKFFIRDKDACCIRGLFALFNPTAKVRIAHIEAIDCYGIILSTYYPEHLLKNSAYLIDGGNFYLDYALIPKTKTEKHIEPTEVSKIVGKTYNVREFTQYINYYSTLKAILSISAIIDDVISYRTHKMGIELEIPNNILDKFKQNLFLQYPKYAPAFNEAEKNAGCFIFLTNGVKMVTIHNKEVEQIPNWALDRNGHINLSDIIYDYDVPF